MRFFNLFLGFLGLGSDVITVTTGTAGAPGSTAADFVNYITAQMLEVAELRTVLDQFGQKQGLPSNNSKTVQFVREEKLVVASTPTQLVEGQMPDAEAITINQFTATTEQYGNVVRISDLAELTAKHDVVQRTMYMLALQVAETYDQLIFTVLDAATNSYRPNNRTSDTTVLGTDHVAYNDLISNAAKLFDAGGRPFADGSFVFVCAPQVKATLLKDPDFKASVQFAKPESIWRGEIANLGGFRIVQSNAPAFAVTAVSTSGRADKIYSSFGIGQYAYQITDLQNARMYSEGPGGPSDVLQQNRKMGWKFAFKTLITNQSWIRRFRSAGLDSVTNP